MMYFLLILFFTSLASIIFMIARKLSFSEHGEIPDHDEVLLEIPYLKEMRNAAGRGVRKYGYALLVVFIRFYVRAVSLFRDKYREIKMRIKNRSTRNGSNGEKKEISKFLKIIGEYKHKIREIKHRIKREEDL